MKLSEKETWETAARHSKPHQEMNLMNHVAQSSSRVEMKIGFLAGCLATSDQAPEPNFNLMCVKALDAVSPQVCLGKAVKMCSVKPATMRGALASPAVVTILAVLEVQKLQVAARLAQCLMAWSLSL